MVEIFRKFMWRGAQEAKKWALDSWTHITKHKLAGGLGLRDHYTFNQVMGAELWWRWIQGGSDIWKIIWN